MSEPATAAAAAACAQVSCTSLQEAGLTNGQKRVAVSRMRKAVQGDPPCMDGDVCVVQSHGMTSAYFALARFMSSLQADKR